MAEFANPQLVTNLDSALEELGSSLTEAGRSLSVVRSQVAQIASLVEVVQELESMLNKARADLGMEIAAPPTSQPALRPLPQPVTYPAPAPIAEQPAFEQPTFQQPAYDPQPVASEPEPIEMEPEPEPAAQPQPGVPASVAQSSEQTSHCLKLGVASKAGSLDLKAVDGSVNENPAVVDVALLDYDGRRATLKLWINGSADPAGVRDALMGSLRRRLGDESDADVQIEFEGAA